MFSAAGTRLVTLDPVERPAVTVEQPSLTWKLQATVAAPLVNVTLDNGTVPLVIENGAITAHADAMMFATSAPATEVYSDAISPTGLATTVTGRSALISSVTSMLPNYMVSISGVSSANSMADTPRWSEA